MKITCKCKVCNLRPDLRAYIDRKIVELKGSSGGRRGAGLNSFAREVTSRPNLGISSNQLESHRDGCWARPCEHYQERPPEEVPDVGV